MWTQGQERTQGQSKGSAAWPWSQWGQAWIQYNYEDSSRRADTPTSCWVWQSWSTAAPPLKTMKDPPTARVWTLLHPHPRRSWACGALRDRAGPRCPWGCRSQECCRPGMRLVRCGRLEGWSGRVPWCRCLGRVMRIWRRRWGWRRRPCRWGAQCVSETLSRVWIVLYMYLPTLEIADYANFHDPTIALQIAFGLFLREKYPRPLNSLVS